MERLMDMARKFALYLKDGHEVRNNIEEITEYFDYSKIVEYFHDGSLRQWLDDRHYEADSIALSALDANTSDFKKKLCYIFHVDENTIEDEKNIVDEFTIKKLEIVRQYTTDKHILDNIAKVAADQDELNELVASKEKEIYLCASSFVIPLDKENITYIGIGNPTAVIKSDKMIDFEAKKIFFYDISFDNEYEKVCEYENGENIKNRLKEPATIAELLGVIVNGRLKDGTFLWKTEGNEKIKSHNFMYNPWPNARMIKYFPYCKIKNMYVVGGVKEENTFLHKDEYLIFTNECFLIRNYLGEIKGEYYREIKHISDIEKQKLFYATSNGKKEFDEVRAYLWDHYLGLNSIRLYLLVVAKIFGDCKYEFNDVETECLSKVRLEALGGKSILKYL